MLKATRKSLSLFSFVVKFDLEGQGQSLPKTIGILTKVFCTSGPNLVILAWPGDTQTDTQMDGNTDAGNDNTWMSKLAPD